MVLFNFAMVLFYFAGLLFWPVFQLLHRRWTACAKRLLIVFVLTLAALVGCWILFFGYFGHHNLLAWLLFPLCNALSLFASTIICIVAGIVGRSRRLATMNPLP